MARRVSIPRTCPSRREPTYARLICRVYRERVMANAFEGVLLKPGSVIDEADLWPTPDYPETPLLVEYAGSDRKGRGHNRSNAIYVLWRYDAAAGEFRELARVLSQNAEWIDQLRPIALAELAKSPRMRPDDAAKAGARVLEVLDLELARLESDDRNVLMNFTYESVLARMVNFERAA